MINTFSFSYPWWYLIFCLGLGIGYSLLMYYRDIRFSDYSHWFTKTLAGLRTISVFIISSLLLSPFVKTIKEDTKDPIVLIASDRSESISAGESNFNLDEYKSKINQLAKDLEGRFEVRQISFGSTVDDVKNDTINAKSTNINKLFKYISDNYSDQNLGAVIVGTDGIYNEGSNPLYSDHVMKAPLYTIALGDTTQKKDLYFQNVLYNKLAYLGDKFPVQVDISAYNCMGKSAKLTLEMVSNGQKKRIAEENLAINTLSYFTTKTFIVNAEQSGVVRYRLRLSTLNDEFNTNNNIKEFFVEVLDARQKILLLANAPHPDLAALKNTITENKNYEVELAYVSNFDGNVAKYNLLVLHNLPSENADVTSILLKADKSNLPRIFIVGMQTSLPKFNKAQDVLKISGNSRNNEDVQAELNPGFSLFTSSENLTAKLKTFPPLQAQFGEYKLAGTGSIYLYQTIKKIKTNFPLIVFDEINGIKTTVICGEGIWKWKFFDHLQNKNFNLVNELVGKTLLLTSIKSDKRKFKASSSKNIYKDNEQILFDAQLFNDSYEMINEPDVNLIIKDENGKEYQYTFSKTQNYYTLNADLFPNGSYSYTASVSYSGKVQSVTGKFNVESIQLEQFDLTARHGFLKALSQKYNGDMISIAGIASLRDKLLNDPNIKPVLYQSKSTKAIIHLKWLFFLILTLLSLEWFLRRYFGNY